MSANRLPTLHGDAVPLDGLQGKRISVIGYGNQGSAHAKNLRDSGLHVVIGARNATKASTDGFETLPIQEAAKTDLVIISLPDEIHGNIFNEQIKDNLSHGATLGFIHGFSIHYKHIIPPSGIGVVMIAPKGPGITVRQRYCDGSGVLSLLAVHQENEHNTARSIALAWAAGIGSGRTCVLESTFADETETDLFGEQAIIVGGLTALIKASFETLVQAGYPPQLAYIECCHEVKQVADILHEKGMAEMMAAISNTAEMGAYAAMDLLDDAHLRIHLQTILKQVQDGSFANRLVQNMIPSKREQLAAHEIDLIGKEIRSMMQPKTD